MTIHKITKLSKKQSKNTKNTKNTNKNITKKQSINTKIDLNLTNFNKVYKDIINQTNITHNFHHINIEFILNYYLLLKGQRHIFQCYCNTKEYKLLKKDILDKYNLNLYLYYNKNEHYPYRVIIYDPNKFNIDNLDKTFGKLFGEQLGDFYICSTNKEDMNNLWQESGRVTIIARINDKFNIELYAQMCKYSIITKQKNIYKIKKIFKDVKQILSTLDKNLIVEMNIKFILKN